MKSSTRPAKLALGLLSAGAFLSAAQESPSVNSTNIKHVLLISIDGMHALDFQNCTNGLSTIQGGAPYCPNLAALGSKGVFYPHASTSKPSDSFPGSGALATGGLPATIGMYYDVSYDRALSPPAKTTPYGIPGGRQSLSLSRRNTRGLR